MNVMPVINPRSGLVDYEIPNHDGGFVTDVTGRLRSGQEAWSASGLDKRCEVLRNWSAAIERNTSAIAEALSRDTGRRFMAQVEITNTLERIAFWTERAPQIMAGIEQGTSKLVPSVKYRHHLVPYPVVGVISPWNVPLILSVIDALPALLAGCSVLLKPSEVTPRFVAALQASIDEVPELAAILGIVMGGAQTGEAVVDNSNLVCFTGSVATGRKVAARAAKNFIPAFLELGGKDPAVILPSADLDNASTAVLRSAAGITGQACQSLERIYVHESIVEEFVELLIIKAQRIEINWPDINQGHIGPFIFQQQALKVQAQLEDAVAKGAVVRTGGGVQNHDGGYWCLPTVITGVDHSMLLMHEETFGPVLPVMPFENVDHGVQLANDSEFGLSAAVFAGSREEGEQVAKRIRAGAVSINDAGLTGFVHDVEKNAFCHSGMGGSRMGDMGFMRFLRKQALLYQSDPALPLEWFDEADVC
jgi:succinate-semialdehyde dehydrogenase/glutarate-semialdehyde dehydrogenase